MSKIDYVNLDLAPETAASVNAAVAAGDYASTAEIIQEALETWRLQRGLMSGATADLRALWQEGIASGTPVEAEPVFARLKAKYAAKS